MSPAFPTRRRAEQFDALLDGRPTEAPSQELADLLALVGQVRSVPEVAPRPEFAASLRERLMAEAPAALAAGAADTTSRLTVGHPAPSRPRNDRRLAVAAAALSIVGATGASAFASQGALPGDTLYPVKRLIEDARAELAMGDHARANALLSQARTRLGEARDLASRDDIDQAAVKKALGDFTESADGASTILLAEYADHGDEQAIGELRSFTAQGVTTLSQLADLLPEELNGALTDAVNTLLTIDHSAAQACPSCGGGITELPSTLIDLLAATTGSTAGTAAAPTSQSVQQPKPPAPAPAPSPSAGTLPGSVTDPLEHLPGGSSGGSSLPSSSPTSLGDAVGDVGGTVGGTLNGVGGAVGGLGDTVGGPVGGVVGGLGDTVGGLGDTVDGTVSGVGGTVDGLLGGATQSPQP